MFQLDRTLALTAGALTNAEQTWQDYLPQASDWRSTALQLTLPLIVACGVLAYLFGLVFGSGYFSGRPTLMAAIGGIVSAALAAMVVAFVVARLAGMFGGKNHFALALAATTLAFVPGYLGQIASTVPVIGWLLSIALFVYALVLLWRILPGYLEVPAERRVMHYVSSLVASVVIMMVLSALLGGLFGGSQSVNTFSNGTTSSSSDRGLLGGVMRQAEIMAAAEEDRFSAPANGKVSEAQVQRLVRVTARRDEILAEKAERMKALTERADGEEDVSFSDLSKMMRGSTELMGLSTVEMELVKSAGGNWAEHQWVKEALRTAWLQQEGSEAIAHNVALYKRFAAELADVVEG